MNSISKAFYGGVLIVVIVIGLFGWLMIYATRDAKIESSRKRDKSTQTATVTPITDVGSAKLYFVEVRFKGYYGSTPLWVVVGTNGDVAIR